MWHGSLQRKATRRLGAGETRRNFKPGYAVSPCPRISASSQLFAQRSLTRCGDRSQLHLHPRVVELGEDVSSEAFHLAQHLVSGLLGPMPDQDQVLDREAVEL